MKIMQITISVPSFYNHIVLYMIFEKLILFHCARFSQILAHRNSFFFIAEYHGFHCRSWMYCKDVSSLEVRSF